MVKGPRTSRTQAQRPSDGRTARRRIVDSATSRFVEHGYGATTLTQIATDAGVAVQTIYFHFGNKRTVLRAAVDQAAAGDDEPVPVLERPWMDRIREEPDPATMIDLWVASGREIFERIAPIMGVVRDAAVVDADMAEQWRTNEAQRLNAFREFARLLDERGALKATISADEAADIVFALNSIEVYLLLTTVRGWSPGRWQTWLASTLGATLLRS
jgi:AcrR family transcriptional regulator